MFNDVRKTYVKYHKNYVKNKRLPERPLNVRFEKNSFYEWVVMFKYKAFSRTKAKSVSICMYHVNAN